MTRFLAAESLAALEGASFAEAMQMIAGAAVTEEEMEDACAGWAEVAAEHWLGRDAASVARSGASGKDPGAALKGALRPYQQDGVAWPRLVSGLGLGACLADDMDLGKTTRSLRCCSSRNAMSPGAAASPTGRIWVHVRDDKPLGGAAPPAASFYASRDPTGENPERVSGAVCRTPLGRRLWRLQQTLSSRSQAQSYY